MRKYPYTTWGCILLILLVIPFILKLRDPRLEIYPAVIFPSGAEVIKTNDSLVSFYEYELYAYKNGFKKIKKTELLDKIPVQYFYPIYEAHFGLQKYSDEFKLYKPPITFRVQNRFSKESVQETKLWLQDNLIKSGYKDSIFKISVLKTTFNIKSKSVVYKQLINEKVFELY